MTHIICPHCGKTAMVDVYGRHHEVYEGMLNLPWDLTEIEQMITNREYAINNRDSSLIDDVYIPESTTDFQVYTCSACGGPLDDEQIVTGVCAYLKQLETAI